VNPHSNHTSGVHPPFPSSMAPANLFALLSWCCALYAVLVRYSTTFRSSALWTSLATSMATLLDLLRQPSTRAKSSIQKGAVVRTRRALRSVNIRVVILGLNINPLAVSCSSARPHQYTFGPVKNTLVSFRCYSSARNSSGRCCSPQP
jgi:hypothetical protein